MKIDPASKVDQHGARVAPGDTVAFHLDTSKPWKHRSVGTVIRWVSNGIAEIRYRGSSTADHGEYDLASHEFALLRLGRNSRKASSMGARQ